MTKGLARVAERWLLPGVVAVALLAIVLSATMSHGFPVRELDLNDTGIWISNDADGELGRINKAVGSLDARLGPPGARSPSYQLDILQDGNLVLGWRQSNATAFQINTALAKPAGNAEIAVDQLVMLDTETSRLVLPGGKVVALPADQSPRLQQPGPAADWVLVATRTALLRVGLCDGLVNPVDTGGNGEPASPVRLGGCDFAAWAGAGRVSRACDNTRLEGQQVDRTGGLIRPVFRVSHSLILLNDQANGRAGDLDAQRSIDNWPGGTATCRISDSDLSGACGNSWTQGNVVNTTDKLHGGYWIEVTCGGVSSGPVPWGG